MMKFYYLGDSNRNVNRGLNGQQFRIFLFLSNLHSNHLQMKNVTLIQKSGNTPLKSPHNPETIIFVIFWEALQFEAHDATAAHLPHGFMPTKTCPTKIFNGGCLGYVAFLVSCKLFISIGNHLHIVVNRKTCLGYVASKPQR